MRNQTNIQNPISINKKQKNLRHCRYLLALATIGLVASTFGAAQAKETQHAAEPPLRAVYNPYKIEHLVNHENEIRGYAVATEEYSSEKHGRAMKYLSQGLKDNHDLEVDIKAIPEGVNNEFIKNVSFSFGLNDPKSAILHITDAREENKRFSIPDYIIENPGPSETMRLEMIGFQWYEEPFSFQFTDLRDSNNVFIHANQSNFVFMDKFIQFDLQLPSQRVFGLGERYHEFALGEGTWTMWARSPSDFVNHGYDDGTGGKQGYGVHPFMLVQGKHPGDFFGVFFRNSNAQSPILKYSEDGTSTLSYIATGGQLQIEFFLHGSVRQVIQQYWGKIGYPELPPFWSLGWAQSSYAYDSQAKVEAMIKGYSDAKFPLETVFLDIPYMDKDNDFTVDTVKFPDLKKLADDLHDKRMKLVVILDPGLQVDPDNKYYNMAVTYDALIKSAIHSDVNNGAVTLKSVNGGEDVFLDFFHPDSAKVWQEGLQDLYNQVNFDGLWLDMNEITGFCNGECPKLPTPPPPPEEEFLTKRNLQSDECDKNVGDADTTWYKSYLDQSEVSTYFLPFIPGFKNGGDLEEGGAISLNATHHAFDYEKEYNLHSINGFVQSEQTYAFLTGSKSYEHTDNRPFILTRSTFPGSGKFASHWLGDNWRDWKHLKYSVAGIMNMNMFGIPHTGADVCGFQGATLDQEMCLRWIQLAQFYPFARIHYGATFDDKPIPGSEPYKLTGDYQSKARDAYYARYQYLRHMYTCLFEAKFYGYTCFDPLFFHFPLDENTFTNIEESFMIGSAIKVSPILAPGVLDTFDTYFPKGKWVSMQDYTEVIDGGKVVQLKARSSVNVHLMPGKMIPFQDNSDQSIMTTAQLLEKPIQIIANRDEYGRAVGSIFLDKGQSRQELNYGQFEYYQLSLQSKTLQKYLKSGFHGVQNSYFDKLVIVNAEDLRDTDFACAFNPHLEMIALDFIYDAKLQTLNISYNPTEVGTHLSFSDIRQISFGNSKVDLNLCNEDSLHYTVKEGQEIDLKNSQTSFLVSHNAKVLPDLNVTLRVVEANTLNIKWTFDKVPVDQRVPFEVPEEIISVKESKPFSQLSRFIQVTMNPFELKILNSKGDTVVKIHEMFLHSYLNYIGQTLYTTKGDDFTGIFGLGDRVQFDIFYDDGVYNMWNHDGFTPFDNGKPPSNSVYGTNPFYMFKHEDSSWVGVFHKLAANQDYVIKNDKEKGEVSVTQLAVGGVADLYYIIDINPISVLSGYYDIVGKPVVIPQWALGWHQCRWGYKTTQDLKDVVGNYSEYNLPLDVQWSDIDYMYSYRDFTYDPFRFKNLHIFVDDLHHNKNMRYVPIIDAGIAVRPWTHYPAYDAGVEQDVFMKINDGQTFIGNVWPNDAAFPDFFNQRANDWWSSELDLFHKSVAIDGLWLDMNEASNFCGGVCYPDQRVDDPEKHNLIYTPGNREIEHQAIPMDAYHANHYKEIDTHNLFGTMETLASHNWFQSRGNRTFIVSRSSFAGYGKFGAKWLGDNFAATVYMAQSVTGIMMQNMFGVPFTGSDICGFAGDTNPELCARWHAVGAFQPFSRNHNAYGDSPQEPYAFADDYYEPGISYLDIMRKAMRTKYSIIRYYYTQIMMMSLYGGSPVYKPVFFDYPDDMNTFQNIENNVLIGKSVKLSMISNQLGVNSGDFYFPAGRWCNVLNYTEPCFTSTGASKTYRTKAYDYYLHLKEGHIFPYQDAFKYNVNTTVDLQKKPIELLISGKTDTWSGLDWQSYGHYYNDDGLALKLEGNNNIYTLHATQFAQKGTTKIQIQVQTQAAYNYGTVLDPYCTAVNSNDYVDVIRIVDATRLGAVNSFHVKVTYVDGTSTTKLGDANLDKSIDQLVFKSESPICLPAVALITFTKLS